MPDPVPPTLYLFAGPNGSGKSTLFERFQEQAGQVVEQVNGDALQQQHPTLAAYTIIELAAARIKELTAQRATFSIENNLATADNYKLLRGLKAVGYRLELVYISLDSVAECQFRVAQRVAEGGHAVPPAIIEQRYQQSLSLLKQHYLLFDRITLVDNTDREFGFQTAAVIEYGRVQQQSPTVLAAWVAKVTRHIQVRERLL